MSKVKGSKKREKIEIGDLVQWECKPYQEQSFWCIGRVIGLYDLNMGGHHNKHQEAARIEVETHRYIERMKRTTTCISIKRLKRIG